MGVRVNVVNPGYFPSGMTPIGQASKDELRGEWGIPLGRAGTAKDYAQVVFSLISNAYMTGAELLVDGGWLLESAF